VDLQPKLLMTRLARITLFFWFSVLPGVYLQAQSNTYILNGYATQNSCNCYTLTQPVVNENGSVWNAGKIDLTQPFDFVFNVFLGCLDQEGADGIVFMLQPISTSIGTTGEGMGFQGVAPSIGISLDTWQNLNLNDPVYDHISIQANGVVAHGSDLAGPVPASPVSDNIEDCKWHLLRISWDPAAYTLKAYFDGSLRVQATVNLVATIFNNDPMVYWGFSAATGGSVNLQRFCTALNPLFSTGSANDAVCLGKPIQFNNQSQSFAPIKSYYWDFGDGTTSTVAAPGAHLYQRPDVYTVKLAITGMDGCNSDTLEKVIRIGDTPMPAFSVFDTCAGLPPRIIDQSVVNVGSVNTWHWLLDGTTPAVQQAPQFGNLPAGTHHLQLAVASDIGCPSDTVMKSFNLAPVPVIDFAVKNGCVNDPLQFTGVQSDNQTTVTGWNWQWETNNAATQQTATIVFANPGNKTIQLTATASNGCRSLPVSKSIFINAVHVFAGNDTIVLKESPFQLHATVSQAGTAPYTVSWQPFTGLDNSSIPNPGGMLEDDQVYLCKATTQEGCQAEDSVKVTVFKGSAVYVPTGFTPNGDGRNDVLRPYLAAIKELSFFSVYNRWGQLVFTTNQPGNGWDGTINGIQQPVGTYVWRLKAVDVVGNVYVRQGTTTLIR
jgi:gliding motility-associated-like protein